MSLLGFAALVLVRSLDWSVIEAHFVTHKVMFPHIPGLLSLRELPALLDAFDDWGKNPK
jgi:deoxyinosine 3'endonuclease (endonuclease V)